MKIRTVLTVVLLLFGGFLWIFISGVDAVDVTAGTTFNCPGYNPTIDTNCSFTVDSITTEVAGLRIDGNLNQIVPYSGTYVNYTIEEVDNSTHAIMNWTEYPVDCGATVLHHIGNLVPGRIYSIFYDYVFLFNRTADASGFILFLHNINGSDCTRHYELSTDFTNCITLNKDMHEFLDTRTNITIWRPLNTSTEMVTIRNCGSEVDGTNEFIQLKLPYCMYNDTNYQCIGRTVYCVYPCEWIVKVAIEKPTGMGNWHTIDLSDPNVRGDPDIVHSQGNNRIVGVVNISDHLWDYTWDTGDYMHIQLIVYVMDYFEAGYYTTAYPLYDDEQYYYGAVTVYDGQTPPWGQMYEDMPFSDQHEFYDTYFTSFNTSITLTDENNTCPFVPTNPTPENNSLGVPVYHPYFEIMCTDIDRDPLIVDFCWGNDTVFKRIFTTVDSYNAHDDNMWVSCVYDGILTPGTQYWWYVNVSDGNCWNKTGNFTFRTSIGEPPIIFNALPQYGLINVSLQPQLSVQVHDPDSDNVTVYFYDDSDDIIGIVTLDLSGDKDTDTAAVTYTTAIMTNTWYYWYVRAFDSEGNNDYWPPSAIVVEPFKEHGNYMVFKTLYSSPPIIVFRSLKENGDVLPGVNIKCIDTNTTVTTDANGYGSMSFNWEDYNQEYSFTFNKTGYVSQKHDLFIVSQTYKVTMKQPGGGGGGGTGWNDIGDMFMDAISGFGSIGKSIIAIIICIGAALFVHRQYDAHIIFVLTVFFTLFGMFIAFGIIDMWLIFIPGAIVAAILANQLWAILFGEKGKETV